MLSTESVLWIVAGGLFIAMAVIILARWHHAMKTKKAIRHLRAYIRKSMKEGVPRDILAHRLRNAGWQEDVVHYETMSAEQEMK